MQAEDWRQDTGSGGISDGVDDSALSVLRDDPRHQRYFKMLGIGLPLLAVKHAMTRDGLDASILNQGDGFIVDPSITETDGALPFEDCDPAHTKYYKMLNMGIPPEAVRYAMEKDGLDHDVVSYVVDDIMDVIRTKTRGSQHWSAFGKHTKISWKCREDIHGIKHNDPDFIEFTLEASLHRHDAAHFSDLAWELLSCYIADNDHLMSIGLSGSLMTDAKMALLFKRLVHGSLLEKLSLVGDRFGVDGVQSMVPFLKNSENLTLLEITQNNAFNTKCFEVIMDALHGGPVKSLRLRGCAIDDISAFDNFILPHLQILDLERNAIHNVCPSLEQYTELEQLWLEGNKIGKEGFKSIAKLLQQEDSSLQCLDLTFTYMCDEDAEIIANSLRYNNSLYKLRVEGNKIKEKGRMAILKLLNDVSSIKATFNSNHTLRVLELPRSIDPNAVKMFNGIDSAIRTNKDNIGNSFAAGRAKVLDTQLNSSKRMELSRLQQIDYYYGNLFYQIEPVILPNILALVDAEHCKNELYRMIVATVSDLASIVNKKTALRERIAENVTQIAALNTEHMCQAAVLAAEHERQVTALGTKNLHLTGILTYEISELEKELKSLES